MTDIKDGLKYEQVPLKTSKTATSNEITSILNRLSTSKLLWFLIKRHKVGLLAMYGIGLTAYLVLPWSFITALF